MGVNRLLKDAGVIKQLAQNLSKSEKVNSFDKGEDKEAWIIAIGFSDLEKSFSTFREVYLPRLLTKDITGENVENVLFDIGMLFSHILYHLKEAKYFENLLISDDN